MKRAILALLLLLAVNAGANEGFGVGGNGATGPSGPTGASGAAGGGGGTGTTNQVIKFTNGAGGVIGDSGVSDDGTTVSSAEHVSVTTKELQQQYTNNTSTGTTASKFVKWDGAGKVVVAAAATDAVKGICRTNCGTSGSAQVAISGASVACVFDNATTANDYVTVSSAGGCHDSGSSFPVGTPVVGTIPSTNGGAGTYNIDLNGTDVASATIAGGGNGKIGGSGLQGQVAYFSGTTTLAGAGPTSGGIPYWNSTTTMAASGALGASAVVYGGGAGTAPATDSNITINATNHALKLLNVTEASDASVLPFELRGTLATTPSTTAYGGYYQITSAGSASQIQRSFEINMQAGYTGSSTTEVLYLNPNAAGTGNTLNMESSAVAVGNFGLHVVHSSAAGLTAGVQADGGISAVMNIGSLNRAVNVVAGTNIGTMSLVASSTEGTDFKNIGHYINVGNGGSSFITGVNVSVGELINTNGTGDLIRGYNSTTLNYSVTSGGNISTAGTFTSTATGALGWTPVAGANTACNTTCTSACVFGTDAVTGGILACTDATADVCLCAGAS